MGQYCGPSNQKMQSESIKYIEFDIEEYILFGKNNLQGTDKACILLFSYPDFADINRYQICPHSNGKEKI